MIKKLMQDKEGLFLYSLFVIMLLFLTFSTSIAKFI